LNDPSDSVRVEAAQDLGKLMTLSTRIEQLMTELLNTFATVEADRKETFLQAIANVLRSAGTNVPQKTLESVQEKLSDTLLHLSPGQRDLTPALSEAIALTLGQLSDAVFTSFMDSLSGTDENTQSHVLAAILAQCPERMRGGYESSMIKSLGAFVNSKEERVRLNASAGIKSIAQAEGDLWQTNQKTLVLHLVTLISDTASTIKLSALDTLKSFAKQSPYECQQYLNELVPPLMERVKDRSSLPVKLASERTLFYVLQVKKDPTVLESYAQSLRPAQARPIQDYCKRVLSKLGEDE